MKTVEEIRKTYPDFKSPQELGITDEEYCALNEVREGLCEGRYVHDSGNTYQFANGFNMACPYMQHGCGTVACIGGWMAHLMNPLHGPQLKANYVFKHEGKNSSHALARLFHPCHFGTSWRKLLPKQAATACANFLKGNTSRPWDKI